MEFTSLDFARVSPHPRSSVSRIQLLVLVLVSLSAPCWGAEPVPPAAVPGRADDTNSQDILRGYLQLQEQLHATQLAIEHNRAQAEAAAEQNAKVLTGATSRSTAQQQYDSPNRVSHYCIAGYQLAQQNGLSPSPYP